MDAWVGANVGAGVAGAVPFDGAGVVGSVPFDGAGVVGAVPFDGEGVFPGSVGVGVGTDSLVGACVVGKCVGACVVGEAVGKGPAQQPSAGHSSCFVSFTRSGHN